ncbi:helix-turn-helix domain-containing protein [Nonomuraea sp. KM90]|uniref:helix-turn-helix domain-containing protein n=1 Tax=Nonomuraea sp. KM90 TaxID=3457428 RepID=UPI003FCEAA76
MDERFRQALKDRNLSQALFRYKLAEQGFPVTTSYVSGLCSGVRDNPNVSLLVAAARVLHVSLDWLCGADEDESGGRTDAAYSAAPPRPTEVIAGYKTLPASSQRSIAHLIHELARLEKGKQQQAPAARPPTWSEPLTHVPVSTHPFSPLQVAQALTPALPGNPLGQRLANLRAAAKVSAAEAAAAIGASEQVILGIEEGERLSSETELGQLLTLYGVTAPEHRTLIFEVARGEHAGAWWLESYFAPLPLWLVTIMAAEANAGIIKGYAAEGIPALLQTEDYARAARAAAHYPDQADEHMDLAARLVLERQIGPLQQQSARLWWVIRAAALLDMPGDRDVKTGQITHLIDLSKRDNVALRIIPLDGERYCPRGGSFTIMQRFGRPNLVCVNGLVEDDIIAGLEEADAYLMAHIRLDWSAVPDHQTVQTLADIRRHIAES